MIMRLSVVCNFCSVTYFYYFFNFKVSPIFKKSFNLIQKKRTQRHPFERVATPYQVYTWTAPNLEHTIDSIRAEDGMLASFLNFCFENCILFYFVLLYICFFYIYETHKRF